MSLPAGSSGVRIGASVVLMGLFAGVASWIVMGEGAAYRASHRKAVAVAVAVEPQPLSPPAPEARPEPGSDPKPVEPRPAPAVASPEPEARAPVVAASPPQEPPGPPLDPFWSLPEQKKIWDLDHLTVEDERRLGADLNRMIRHVHPALEVGPLPRRLEDAAEPYLRAVTRKDVTYTLTVLDCDGANVFSHPGGYIYVCRGLFDFIAEDEDYALEFALAHEIAHVDQGHAIRCLRDPEAKAIKMGTVPMFFFVLIPWGYAANLDLDADRWAVERMAKLGKSRYESLSFLRKLEDYARKNGFENVRKKPMDEPKIPFLDNHLRAHPIPRERLKRAKLILDPQARS